MNDNEMEFYILKNGLAVRKKWNSGTVPCRAIKVLSYGELMMNFGFFQVLSPQLDDACSELKNLRPSKMTIDLYTYGSKVHFDGVNRLS